MIRKIIFFLGIIFFITLLNAEAKYREAVYFNLSTVEGESFSLADFKDKALILFFWTTWCPYCRMAITQLNEIAKELRDSDIEILGINVGEPREKVKRFLKNYSVQFKVLLDTETDIAYAYRVLGVPTYVLIDKDLMIKFQANYLPQDYREILKD